MSLGKKITPPFCRVYIISIKGGNFFPNLIFSNNRIISTYIDKILSAYIDTILSTYIDTIISTYIDTIISTYIVTTVSTYIDTILSTYIDKYSVLISIHELILISTQ